MDLREGPTAYSSPTVDKDIREFFRAERKRLKLNQENVADAGGLEQSTISKIERDPPYDPGIKSFLRAIRGLGMKPSEFFARFEQHVASSSGSVMRLQKQDLKNEDTRKQDRHSTLEEALYATPALGKAHVDLTPFEVFGAALGKSLGQQLARPHGERKAPPRSRKKSSGGGHDRGDTRRPA